MKNYIFVLGFLGLMGCSVTEAQFEDQQQTLLCSTCETITCDGDVEVDAGDDESAGTIMPCDFVTENADACLGGEWTCDPSQGFEVVVMPDICADVYDCHQSEEDTGPEEDTASDE
jgi:hypothetical protein